MKSDKKRRKKEFRNGLLEAAVLLALFGIGVLIISLVGMSIDSSHLDFDTIALIGILVPVVICWVVCTVKDWFKKTKEKRKRDE